MLLSASFITLLAFLAAWMLVPYLFRLIGEWRLRRACRTSRAIALTYDDGPGRDLTLRVLQLLNESNVPGTFFPLGRHLNDSPDVAKQLATGRHQIGSHTFNHTNAWKSEPLTAAADFRAGARAVDSIGGDGYYFRPPYGKLTVAGVLHGLLAGIRFAWWTIDTQDSWKPRPIESVLEQIEREGGGVVLMHDFDGPYRGGSSQPHSDLVLAFTREIIDYARRNNFRLVAMQDLTTGRPR